ncbi:hypothetical protein [Rubrivivax sp. A210]|uniref:hypothetical protein n=1 Tax=Rubrivivax sp. A210 TaxID=2772301 RepID=UPI00191986F3|nr:hypothetical protein [Rubrivivax sp. A210]
MKHLRGISFLLVLVSVPSLAWANAGIPMLALVWPAQWLAFFPVVAFEALYIARTLSIPFRQQLKPLAQANLLSTLVGIPLAWAALLVVEFAVAGLAVTALPENVAESNLVRVLTFPFTAPWIGGSSEHEVRLAFIVLMFPFCAVSAYVEAKFLKRHFSALDAERSRRAIIMSNVLSYLFLAAITLLAFSFA